MAAGFQADHNSKVGPAGGIAASSFLFVLPALTEKAARGSVLGQSTMQSEEQFFGTASALQHVGRVGWEKEALLFPGAAFEYAQRQFPFKR